MGETVAKRTNGLVESCVSSSYSRIGLTLCNDSYAGSSGHWFGRETETAAFFAGAGFDEGNMTSRIPTISATAKAANSRPSNEPSEPFSERKNRFIGDLIAVPWKRVRG